MTQKHKLKVSSSPHIFHWITTNYIMWAVVIALLPAVFAGVYYFGLHALLIILVSTATAIITEALIQKLRKKEMTINDGSAVITGLLLALVLPPTVPLWTAALGSFIAISIGKHVFGGLGQNIFNPALVGRAFLVVSFPILLTTWALPITDFSSSYTDFDAVTAATPLKILKEGGYNTLLNSFNSKTDMYYNLLIGNIGGSIGETSALALIFGGFLLLFLGIIGWRIPFTYIGTVALLSYLLKSDPLLHILSGGLMIGAFFMATDYVTTPMTKKGKLLFGIGCGIITILLRFYSSMAEGVMYSILLMNAFTPMIDRYTKPRVFGKNKILKKR